MKPGHRKIVTRHLTQAKAEKKLGKLFTWQAEGNIDALTAYGLTASTPLEVVHERRMAFKWAVVQPA